MTPLTVTSLAMTSDHYDKVFCSRAKAVLFLQACGHCKHICTAVAVAVRVRLKVTDSPLLFKGVCFS